MKKNDEIELNIRDVTLEGDGVGEPVPAAGPADAEAGGPVVFCFAAKKTLPGSPCKATIIKVTKNYAVARLADRSLVKSALCGSFPHCGGCSLLHFSYEETLELKEKHVENCLARIGSVSPVFEKIIPSPKTEGYRNKTVYRFKISSGRLISGYFKRNSHDVVPMDECFLENALSRKIRLAFTKAAEKYKLSLYDEQTGRGFLRGLMVRTSLNENEAMAVILGSFGKLPKGFADELLASVPEIASLYLNVNPERNNTLLGEKFIHISGSESLRDTIGPATFEISPQSFFQVNPHQTPRLYEKAYEYAAVDNGETILDLFCGIGTIGQYFARRAAGDGKTVGKIYGIEYTKQAVENARQNAVRNGVNEFEYFDGDAGEVLQTLDISPDVAVVDPPRKGMDLTALDALASLPSLSRIVYVSCDPATLARDLKLFSEHGFKTEKACPCDMFPFAGHVETVVLLVRKTPDAYVRIKMDMEDFDLTKPETKATYEGIKAYVKEQTGLNVTHLDIAQTKRKSGIIERENYNLPKSADAKQPQCTKEKEEAILEALKHFQMIPQS